jgi:hypothetical protein
MIMKTFCRFGYTKKFVSKKAFKQYCAREGFINVRLVEWEKSRLANSRTAKIEHVLHGKNLARFKAGYQLMVIEHDGCDDESDMGVEFVFQLDYINSTDAIARGVPAGVEPTDNVSLTLVQLAEAELSHRQAKEELIERLRFMPKEELMKLASFWKKQ